MDQMLLFGLFAVTMVVAWKGHRTVALALFGLSLILSLADYMHHATDKLPLSF
jgi:hypothetical protein